MNVPNRISDNNEYNECPEPDIQPDWAIIRVLKAGICRTDMEIIRGYKGFKGILGHKFIGIEQCENTGTYF